MACIDAELFALTRFLADSAVDISHLGARDPHFYDELSSKVDAIIFYLAEARARIKTEVVAA
jgi:hypothetical protein